MEDNKFVVGDVFTTTFWGIPEVCIICSINNAYVDIIRLESIRNYNSIKKDFCGAEFKRSFFDRINKILIHHSGWYSEYKHLPSPPKQIKEL